MIPSKLIVILISGKAGVGKTTFANLLRKELGVRGKNSCIVPFASALKAVAMTMTWDGQKDDAGRHLLQGLGTLGRMYNPDVWIDLSYKNVMEYALESGTHFFLSDDWRFPNEYTRLSSNSMYEVFKIHIDAPERECLKGTPRYDDISETSLPDSFTPEAHAYYDLQLCNNGTMDELHITSRNVVQYILDNCQKWQV
jgi:DNA polymerase III delta prime subunit